MKNVNVVIFWYMNDWGLYGRTYESIAKGLAEHKQINKVLCILPPSKTAVSWKPFELVKQSNKLLVVTPNPRFINATGGLYSARQWINKKLTPLSAIKYFSRLLGFRKSNTILWVFPHHKLIDDLIANIPHKLLITQIVDNVLNKSNISDETKTLVTRQYDELPKKSDITITSSLLNFNIFKSNSGCHLVENGLDTAFLSDPTPTPCANTGSKPRVGYLGFISERTDLTLLTKLAIERPNYELLIAGPDNERLLLSSGLLDLPNVITIDYLPYSEAPSFIQSLDVCLIPHVHSAFSQSMSPLKLFQYLASGRPIVTTEVAGTERWKDLVYIADNDDSFIHNVDKALAEDSRLAAKRISAAKHESWPHRIEDLLNIIEKHNAEYV